MAKRLRIHVDAEDFARLAAWSKARGWTVPEALRAAIDALTLPPATDPLLAASGFIDGLPEDCSIRFDRYLDATEAH